MRKINTHKEYQEVMVRIEELLKIVGNDTPSDNKDFIEFDFRLSG